jgi:hypothetical protein
MPSNAATLCIVWPTCLPDHSRDLLAGSIRDISRVLFCTEWPEFTCSRLQSSSRDQPCYLPVYSMYRAIWTVYLLSSIPSSIWDNPCYMPSVRYVLYDLDGTWSRPESSGWIHLCNMSRLQYALYDPNGPVHGWDLLAGSIHEVMPQVHQR